MNSFTQNKRVMPAMRILAAAFVLALCLGIGMGIQHGYANEGNAIAEETAAERAAREKAEQRERERQLRFFNDVLRHVHEEYVDEVDYSELMAGAIRGMLDTLDPHSSYLDEEAFAEMLERNSGEFGGLGIQISMEDGLVRVIAPIDDTPAARAGIKAGDFIIRIDDEDVLGLNANQAIERMRGDIGTDIDITIKRGEDEPFDLTLTRATIQSESVRHESYGDVGYIRITNFNERTTTGLKKSVSALKETHGDNLAGVVLDLRDNPGGLLPEAISVSDAFLDSGIIVSTRGRNGRDASSFSARRGDFLDGAPMVVLINRGSASASEIVAGALRDNDRALLMGEKSFGKGSVQSIIPLRREGVAIRLTTGRFYTPSGERIQAKGIDPDIVVEPAIIDTIEAEAVREENLPGALDNAENATGDDAPGENGITPIDDYQLARAVDLLRGIDAFRQVVRK